MLHQQSSANGYLLSDWLTEPECLHEFQVASGQNGPWETLAIKPDGYFRLWQDGERHDFFLEVDLGNVSLPRFEQKLIRYRKYAGCGAFTEAYGSARFVVLTVTLGERRLSHLADLAGRGFAHLITTFPRIEAAGVFGCMCNTNAASSVSLATAIRMAA